MLRFLLVLAGTISFLLGIIGIFVPGLPTTPFLLLTAVLYMRSSDILYQRLMKQKYVGAYILTYRRNNGLLLRSKIWSIACMWAMIIVSSVFFIESALPRICLGVAGITGTIVMGFCVRTGKKPASENEK